MKTLLVGASNSISQHLCRNEDLSIRTIGLSCTGADRYDARDLSLSYLESFFTADYECYVFLQGYLLPKKINQQSDAETYDSLKINLLSVVKAAELILDTNPVARVFIVGSESGKKGSYDTTYFLSRAALRSYVFEKRLRHVGQQLLLISPAKIVDSRMTQEREDYAELLESSKDLPKGRMLYAKEIADLLHNLMVNVTDHLTNTEIEINGGKFARDG